MADLLKDKRSLNTRRAYERDLREFFQAACHQEPTPALIAEFLSLERFTAIGLVLNWKAGMIDRGLSEATVNRRLAALKSLVRFAQKVGRCDWSLEEVSGERLQTYRDTSGIDAEQFAGLLALCDATLKGSRDRAILRLLWDNALRRNEIAGTNIQDLGDRQLKILGKGRGTQQEAIALSAPASEAVWGWVRNRQAAGLNCAGGSPLFIALDRAHCGHRLTGNAIYNLVRDYADRAGIKKPFSPHRCRHSSITAALEATGGDVRRVQKLSRHKNLQTLLIYDDARQRHQQEISDLLSKLV
jgi:integrase/recombinase XerC